MRKTVRKAFLLALAVLLALTPAIVNAGQSYVSISLNSTGEVGNDIAIHTGRAKTAGYNNGTGAWNTLYIAVQPSGTTGVTATYPVEAGAILESKTCSAGWGNYHVLLDPAGPNYAGCVGAGAVAPKAPD